MPSVTLAAPPVLHANNEKPYAVHAFPQAGMFVFYANTVSTTVDGLLPSCSGDHRWSIKTDSPGAKETISMIIAAKTSGRTITVKGNGTCNPSGYGYLVSYLYLN